MTENAKIININEYEKNNNKETKSILTEEMLDLFDMERSINLSKKTERRESRKQQAYERKRNDLARFMLCVLHIITGVGVMYMGTTFIVGKFNTIVSNLITFIMLIVNVFVLTNSYKFIVSRIGICKKDKEGQ